MRGSGALPETMMLQRISRSFKNLVANMFWFSLHRRWGVRRVFDDVYDGQGESATFRAIFREYFGEEYEPEIDHCGFVTRTDLKNFARHVDVEQDGRLADLACGSGGAGLWVARETGSRLVGVDISPVAVEQAEARIAAFGLQGRAEFRAADFAKTGLEAGSFDAAMSVDALFLVPDKVGSVRETARILKPRARFVCTTWEVDQPGYVNDYHPVLDACGFDVEAYAETAGWKERQVAVYSRIVEERETLIREMGKASALIWVNGAKFELSIMDSMKRIMIVARKRS
jgi:ubiquinone/menaquinone biosynthesis C-methylase UbiE